MRERRGSLLAIAYSVAGGMVLYGSYWGLYLESGLVGGHSDLDWASIALIVAGVCVGIYAGRFRAAGIAALGPLAAALAVTVIGYSPGAGDGVSALSPVPLFSRSLLLALPVIAGVAMRRLPGISQRETF